MPCTPTDQLPRRYKSPIRSLFQQVAPLRPTSMACPPNIWSGLYADGIKAATGSAEGAAGDVDDETTPGSCTDACSAQTLHCREMEIQNACCDDPGNDAGHC